MIFEAILNMFFICKFRLICPPSDWATSQIFIHGTNNTIYGKLYKDKMDGLNSLYPTVEAAMDHVLNSNVKVAYFQNVDFVNSFKKTHCKVFTYLVIYSSSLKLKKKSQLQYIDIPF